MFTPTQIHRSHTDQLTSSNIDRNRKSITRRRVEMNKLCVTVLVLVVQFCILAGQAFAQCEVTLYKHSPPGGKQIVIRQSEFPYGLGQTFWAAPNWLERATGIIANAVQGNFNEADLFWVAGFAINVRKAAPNEVGQSTIGVNVGSLTYGNLVAKVDAAGNIPGIETGTEFLTPQGLYNKVLGPSGWGPNRLE